MILKTKGFPILVARLTIVSICSFQALFPLVTSRYWFNIISSLHSIFILNTVRSLLKNPRPLAEEQHNKRNASTVKAPPGRTDNTDLSRQSKTIRHVVVVPIWKEDTNMLRNCLEGLKAQTTKLEIDLILAVEEVHPDKQSLLELFNNAGCFKSVTEIIHPQGRAGEVQGTGSNYNYALDVYCKKKKLEDDLIYLVSKVDSSVILGKEYLEEVEFVFTAENEYAFVQPVIEYNQGKCHRLCQVSADLRTGYIDTFIRSTNLMCITTWTANLKILKAMDFIDPAFMAEDMMVFWMHESYLNREPKIRVLDKARAYTDTPRTISALQQQQLRWTSGRGYILTHCVANGVLSWKHCLKVIWYLEFFCVGFPLYLASSIYQYNKMNRSTLGLFLLSILSTSLMMNSLLLNRREKVIHVQHTDKEKSSQVNSEWPTLLEPLALPASQILMNIIELKGFFKGIICNDQTGSFRQR